MSARSIGGLGAWFLDQSDRLDARLYGERVRIIGFAAAVTVVASFVDELGWPSTPVLTAFSSYVFLLLATVLLAARLGALRDDAGNWTLALVRRRTSEAVTAAMESAAARRALPSSLRWIALGKATCFLGLLALAVRNSVVLFCLTVEELSGAQLAPAQALDRNLLYGGVVALACGMSLWLLGRRLLDKDPSAKLRPLDSHDQERLRAAVEALPPLIDCADAAQVRELARRAGHPILEQLLGALVDWKPRRFEHEDQYQGSLHRLLRRKMPGADPQRERPVGNRAERTAGRADLVVSDAVLIEMKRGITTATAQRAVGQVRMYVRAWNKGPVMLLLCDADPSAARQFLGREMMDLRKQAPVMLVLAAGASRASAPSRSGDQLPR
ncbi:hypothetical protein WMF04_01760 [Sorangium sp. So ce260]|uniref:hypothetical protein n=1 Tax=Sorangium sp. So ce260 TaxID=3133291 RepID=UPI003F5F019C